MKTILTNAQAKKILSMLEKELHWPIEDRAINYTDEEIRNLMCRIQPPANSLDYIHEYDVDVDENYLVDSDLKSIACDEIIDNHIVNPVFVVVDWRKGKNENLEIKEFSKMFECFEAAYALVDHLTEKEKKSREVYVSCSPPQCSDEDDVGRFNMNKAFVVKYFI